MKQLLVKLTEDEYQALEDYCKRTGRTKSAVIRYQISNLNRESTRSYLLHRKVKRISAGGGRPPSEIIREMRV